LKAGDKKTLYVKKKELTGDIYLGDIDDYTVNKKYV
jgi:hypothetical protein